MQLHEFENTVKKTLHPAGLALFAEHEVEEIVEFPLTISDYSNKLPTTITTTEND